jgi:hypothetical protein
MSLQLNNYDDNLNNINSSTKNCFACLKKKSNENFLDRRDSMNDTKKRIKRKNGINVSKFTRFINYMRYITRINKSNSNDINNSNNKSNQTE